MSDLPSSNSTKKPPPERKRPLGLDEWIAIIIALATFGSISLSIVTQKGSNTGAVASLNGNEAEAIANQTTDSEVAGKNLTFNRVSSSRFSQVALAEFETQPKSISNTRTIPVIATSAAPAPMTGPVMMEATPPAPMTGPAVPPAAMEATPPAPMTGPAVPPAPMEATSPAPMPGPAPMEATSPAPMPGPAVPPAAMEVTSPAPMPGPAVPPVMMEATPPAPMPGPAVPPVMMEATSPAPMPGPAVPPAPMEATSPAPMPGPAVPPAPIMEIVTPGAGMEFQNISAAEVNQDSQTKSSLPIALNSEKGDKLLVNSSSRADYLPLTMQFVSQDNLGYCGVASAVMVLNALNVPAPAVEEFDKRHRFFTQKNAFENPQAREIISSETVAARGMTLKQLTRFVRSHGVSAEAYYSSYTDLDEFRQKLVENLEHDYNFILVNYSRETIAQRGGGHISPVAAYDKESDRFLILDVSRYQYPPVWVTAEQLWQATNTVDPASGKTRGFVWVGQ